MEEALEKGTGSTVKKPDIDRDHGGLPVRKKKRGAMQLIRVALYLLRHRSSKSKLVHHVGVAENKSLWKRLVGSIRPLHLQSNQSPPAPLTMTSDLPLPLPSPSSAVHEQVVVEEVFTPPPCSPTTSSSSHDDMSRYQSALNLQELDRHHDDSCEEDDEDYDDEEVYDDNGGDEMIDAKAEEFIAKFYAQIKIQNKAYNDRYNAYVQRQDSFMV
ncbi:uncharacterized protein LOC110819515 [Carica papaya]|uniref:uncharacterized protein LOC110819515 n=1 Tax=Carica papaya TaxID=3649 RepID=UPI000B8C7681|nr:uncharacterized protein LOC110819515 [Carica papaya]